MQVEGDVKCIQTNFGGHDLSSFGDFAHFLFAFKTAKISLQTMDNYEGLCLLKVAILGGGSGEHSTLHRKA